jgi:hypothetical protein
MLNLFEDLRTQEVASNYVEGDLGFSVVGGIIVLSIVVLIIPGDSDQPSGPQ